MLSFFHREKSSEPVAVFAIETGSVALSVIHVSPSGQGRIVAVHRKALDIKISDSPQDMMRKTAARMDEILNDMFKKKRAYLVARARTLVLLGASWNVSWRERVSIKKDKPFRVTNDTIKESVEDAFKASHSGLSIISSHV